jgi:hypothetical protein
MGFAVFKLRFVFWHSRLENRVILRYVTKIRKSLLHRSSLRSLRYRLLKVKQLMLSYVVVDGD